MRRAFVDAGSFAALAAIGHTELLRRIDGRVEMPAVVQVEIADRPGAGALERATTRVPRWVRTSPDPADEQVELATEHLGREESAGAFHGDVELLAAALEADERVVVTDDRPLRRACRALGVPTAGAIGVVIAAVERGDLDPGEAKAALVAMDEVGPRVTARLLWKAERLIDEAAGARGRS